MKPWLLQPEFLVNRQPQVIGWISGKFVNGTAEPAARDVERVVEG